MPIEVDGKIIATTASAFLEDPDEWSKTVAETMAAPQPRAPFSKTLMSGVKRSPRLWQRRRDWS